MHDRRHLCPRSNEVPPGTTPHGQVLPQHTVDTMRAYKPVRILRYAAWSTVAST